MSALRTRCRRLLISDKPKHRASLGSVSLNTACLTMTQISLGWHWSWRENTVVRPSCCGVVASGCQFGLFRKVVGFVVASSDRGSGWVVWRDASLLRSFLWSLAKEIDISRPLIASMTDLYSSLSPSRTRSMRSSSSTGFTKRVSSSARVLLPAYIH